MGTERGNHGEQEAVSVSERHHGAVRLGEVGAGPSEERSARSGEGLTGQKHDQGKLRWGLVPWKAMECVVRVLTHGAEKYSPGNWRQVPDARRRYFEAAMRHQLAWWHGETNDAETGLHPLAHAICGMLFCLALDLAGERRDPIQ